MKTSMALAALALSLSVGHVALADDVTPAPSSAPAPVPPSAPSPKRAVPDYDGRDPAPASAGEDALWVPRVVLSPVYFTTEYLLRRPLGAVVTAAERADVPRKVYDFFTFGPEHKAGFAPVGMVAFDFNPSVGVYVFWHDAGFDGNDLHLHAEVWPTDWYGTSLTQRIQLGDYRWLQLRGSWTHRPDRVFYGVGPDSLQSNQSRYGEDRVDVGGLLDWRISRGVKLETAAGVRRVNVYDGSYGTDPSLTTEAATGAFAIPYDFGGAYTIEYNRVRFEFDTRAPKATTGSGVRAEVHAEQGNDVSQRTAGGWVKYGGTLAGLYDIDGRGHVLSLSMVVLFADPIGSQPIPFTEQVRLGGDGPMRGYFEGRLVDRSAAVASARYTWPVAPWLDGTLLASFGNVFGTHLESFRPGLARFSSALGLSTSGLQDYPIEFIFGMGSETFDHGAQIDSWRVTLSVNHAF